MTEFEQWGERPIPPQRVAESAPVADPVECGEALVDLTGRSPKLLWDASYARRGLAGAPERCWLREEPARRLLAAAEGLPAGVALLVFDTLRPLRVQQALYDDYLPVLRRQYPQASPEELARRMDDFVALPRKDYRRPAPHTTGGAVDLTLWADGAPLEMGTGFDDFSPRAATRYLEEHPEEAPVALANRRRLYHLLTAAGFSNYSQEWWHFSLGDRAWARQMGTVPRYSYVEPPQPADKE